MKIAIKLPRQHLKHLVSGSLLAGSVFWSCQHTDSPQAESYGRLRLTFDSVVGQEDLVLTDQTYRNAAGEPFTVSKFNYFISNLRLTKADGSMYVVPQANNYFLVQENVPASQTITLDNIPLGQYTGLSFILGVDSLRSTMDISRRTGVLDPGTAGHAGMYWSWNPGYIFVKLEGTSPVAPSVQNHQFFYHIGGFGGGFNGQKTINNIRAVTIQLGQDKATVEPNQSPRLLLTTDVLAIFDGPHSVRIADHSSVMFAPYSAMIADNYVRMIRYNRIAVD